MNLPSPLARESARFSPTPIGRRSMLGGLGMASLGWLASSTSASANSVPADWARSQGPALAEYKRYLSSLGLKNIQPDQVIRAHAKQKGEIWNTLPPRVWWVRMGYTLRVADYIATAMKVKTVEIVSAYRCPIYNAHCEGAKARSWHQANVAVDVKFPVEPALVAAASRILRDRGLFRGGVGGYEEFTHIDTRGVNTNW